MPVWGRPLKIGRARSMALRYPKRLIRRGLGVLGLPFGLGSLIASFIIGSVLFLIQDYIQSEIRRQVQEEIRRKEAERLREAWKGMTPG